MTKEPLSNLARFAFDWADTLCDPDHGCAPYHRMWSFIRLHESGGELPAGKGFFKNIIAEYSQKGIIDVIISGGADTGVMALIVSAAREHGIRVSVTAVDRCLTPLEQMKLYGLYSSVSLRPLQCSIENLPSDLKADLIIGHSILNFIPPKNRLDVFNAWSNALRPGGAVALSQRLGVCTHLSKKRWTPETLEKRRSNLLESLDSSHKFIDDQRDFLTALDAFWTLPIPRNYLSVDEFKALAEKVGFQIKALEADSEITTNSPFSFSSFTDLSVPARYEIVLEKPMS